MDRPVRWAWSALVAVVVALSLMVAVSEGAKRPVVPKKVTAASAAFGKAQAATHKAGVTAPPLVPFIRVLSDTPKSNAGCVAARPKSKGHKAVHPTCAAIFQMQRALKAAKFRKVPSTGVFGRDTRTEIKAFQRAHKIPPSGVYGTKTHKALTRYYDLTGRQRLQAVARTRKVLALALAFHVVGLHAAAVGGNTLTYSQSGSRQFLPAYPRLPPATDCSGLATWIFQSVGLPDPNGFGFRPVGYTGTLAQHGVRVSDWGHLRNGDLVFYGGGYPYGHVTVVIDAARRLVVSHGHTGVQIEPFNYRRVSVIRRYY